MGQKGVLMMNFKISLLHIKRGITLIELLVAIAAALIVAEIIFGIFISTNKASEKSNSRVMLYSEGRLIENQIYQILKKRIPESEIVKEGNQFPSSFTDNSLRIFSPSIMEEQYTPRLLTIKNLNSSENKTSRIVVAEQDYDPETGSINDVTIKDLGAQDDRIDTKIVFQYANQFNELEPQFIKSVDTITTGTIPKLVRYTIILRDTKKDYEPVSFSSAVAF